MKNDIAFIKINFSVLIRAIKNLEDTILILLQSLEIVKNIISELLNIQGDKDFTLKTKMSQLYQKKIKDFNIRTSRINYIRKQRNTTFRKHHYLLCGQYEVCTIDISRCGSFNLYKHILSDGRINDT